MTALVALAVVAGLVAFRTDMGGPTRTDSRAIPTIRMNPPPGGDVARSAFEVEGLEPEDLRRLASARLVVDTWPAIFSLRPDPIGGGDSGGGSRIPGIYRVTGEVLRFEPGSPLRPGMRYRATFDPSGLPWVGPRSSGPITALFGIPARIPGASRPERTPR